MKQIIGLVIVFVFIACKGDGDGGGGGSPSGPPPVIDSLPIHISSYNSGTGLAGDVDFTHSELGSTDKIVLEFNGILIDGGTPPGGIRLPHFTFNLPSGVDVFAMGAGTVTYVALNNNHPDYEVRIRSAENSNYTYTYDHLLNPTVIVGDVVNGGDKIGETSNTKFEADIASGNTAYCPTDLFDEAVASTLESKLTTLFSDWETYKVDTTIYDESTQHNIGCATETGDL